jgi:hypothetical protein
VGRKVRFWWWFHGPDSFGRSLILFLLLLHYPLIIAGIFLGAAALQERPLPSWAVLIGLGYFALYLALGGLGAGPTPPPSPPTINVQPVLEMVYRQVEEAGVEATAAQAVVEGTMALTGHALDVLDALPEGRELRLRAGADEEE